MAPADGQSGDEVLLDVSTGCDGAADLQQPLLAGKKAPRKHKMVDGVLDTKRPPPVDSTIESLDYECVSLHSPVDKSL